MFQDAESVPFQDPELPHLLVEIHLKIFQVRWIQMLPRIMALFASIRRPGIGLVGHELCPRIAMINRRRMNYRFRLCSRIVLI